MRFLLVVQSIGNFPVPSGDDLYLPVTVEKSSALKIIFINQLGQEIKTFDKKLKAGQNLLYFNNLNLPVGIYFVNIKIDDEVLVQKIVVE